MVFVRRFEHAAIAAALLMLFFSGVSVAWAQEQEEPAAVVIDTSVLDYLNPSETPPEISSPAPYSRPVKEEVFRPTLTTPKPRAENFPVEMQVRTESVNPAAPPTKPVKTAAPKKKKPVAKAVAVKKAEPPVPEPKPESLQTAAAEKMPPLPRRRPAFQDKKKNSPATTVLAAEQPIRPGGGGKPMPAVPAKPVQIEPLPLPQEDETGLTAEDPLATQLITPDRHELAASLEAIVVDDEPKKKESFKDKFSLIKTKAERRERKVLMPPPIRGKDTPMAQIEPSLGREKNVVSLPQEIKNLAPPPATAGIEGQIPRMPPRKDYELDYISLPFQRGKDQPDSDMAHTLQDRILPLMKENPNWRLQIQAFADPESGGETTARRLSLARALAVRTWLLDHGIEARRLDVRALGMETDRNPLDRVDLVLFDPTRL